MLKFDFVFQLGCDICRRNRIEDLINIHEFILFDIHYHQIKSQFKMYTTFSYGGGAKPWQQKGTGRARHGSTRSPQWVDGGKVFGPKAPKSHYYMLPFHTRVYGLTHTLTIKFIQVVFLIFF